MPEFDPNQEVFLLSPQVNGEWTTEKGNRVQNITFIPDIINQKVEVLITYSVDQQIFKFRAIIGCENPIKTADPNWKGSKFNLNEICGAKVDFKSNGRKWIETIHDIIQSMGFHPTKTDPCP